MSRIVKGRNPLAVVLGGLVVLALAALSPMVVAVVALRASKKAPAPKMPVAPPSKQKRKRAAAVAGVGAVLVIGTGIGVWQVGTDEDDAEAVPAPVVDAGATATSAASPTVSAATAATAAPAPAPTSMRTTTTKPVAVETTAPRATTAPGTTVTATTTAPAAAPVPMVTSRPGEAAASAGAVHLTGPWPVADVVDGDTVTLRNASGTPFTARVLGIDAPELANASGTAECFGAEAANAMRFLVTAAGGSLYLETDPTRDTIDRDGQHVGYLRTTGGLDLGRQLIEQGYVVASTGDGPYQYQSLYGTAQADADAHDRGLWAASTCGGNAHLAVVPSK
jgi:endonuclease YncB( thermonuclease family)